MGAQHSANKADALVCSRCFSMIGSIEQQIAHRLLASEESGGSHAWHCNCGENHAPAITAKIMQPQHLNHCIKAAQSLGVSLVGVSMAVDDNAVVMLRCM